MMKKRFSKSKSTIDPEEDVDDDTFLHHGRNQMPSSSYGGQHRNSVSDSPSRLTFQQRYDNLEDQKTQLMNRRMEIEARALQSTQRSIGMLRDSEEVGIATTLELERQREQLENTDARLTEINDTLHSSHKHIQGISSIFGSIKNYWSNRKSSVASVEKDVPADHGSRSKSMDATRSRSQLHNVLGRAQTTALERDADEHPALRIRGLGSSSCQSKLSVESDMESQIDRNLDEMVGSISRLKGMAQDLGHEIDSQNTLLEDIIGKTEKADINIEKQNKEINRLIRK